MAIAMTIQQYLADQGVDYQAVDHPPTQSSMQTAQASHIPGDCLAKAVVLETQDGYLLAVLPASHHIRLGQLRACLNQAVDLAAEDKVTSLFADCEVGAVPPIGAAYGLDVIMDGALGNQSEVYFEGGDHATLVRLAAEDFHKLLGDVPHVEFSVHD